MLQSSYVYREYDFRSRNVSVVSLKDIMIPYVPLSIQKVFDKMMNYTKHLNTFRVAFCKCARLYGRGSYQSEVI